MQCCNSALRSIPRIGYIIIGTSYLFRRCEPTRWDFNLFTFKAPCEFCMPPNFLWALGSGLWRSCVTNVKHGDSALADRSLILYEGILWNLTQWVEIHLFWQRDMITIHCWVPLHMVIHLLTSSCHCGISFLFDNAAIKRFPIPSCLRDVHQKIVAPMLHAYPNYKFYIYIITFHRPPIIEDNALEFSVSQYLRVGRIFQGCLALSIISGE